MTYNHIALSSRGTDLSSRATGAAVRTSVLNLLAHQTKVVTVDCSGIRTISESFADELFGILVADNGKHWFREHVHVIGLTESTRGAILRAIDARLSPEAAE